MTDPMTTTRDGDVLTEVFPEWELDAIETLMARTQRRRGGPDPAIVIAPFTEDQVRRLITSHRALQQRLDAAEQEKRRYRRALLETAEWLKDSLREPAELESWTMTDEIKRLYPIVYGYEFQGWMLANDPNTRAAIAELAALAALEGSGEK